MDKDINTVDFIEARAKEITAIEESINKTAKKTMLFQRLPFYKRRRNRNYDKRKSKKTTFRKKDRHFLRTHTFYSKRFFMLKLDISEDISIPFKRRIKSSKYIYKSQDRGFVFDESFRRGYYCDLTDFINININDNNDISNVDNDNNNDISNVGNDNSIIGNDKIDINTINDITVDNNSINNIIESSINLNLYDKVQSVSNLFDVIITKKFVYLIGIKPKNLQLKPIDCVFSLLKVQNTDFSYLKNFKSVKIFRSENGLETHKIICDRSEAMLVYEKLINYSIIPICLEEIHRLAIENSCLTVYDNIKSKIFNIIEKSINKEIIEKYNRTPLSKKQRYDLNLLNISCDKNDMNVSCSNIISSDICYVEFKVIKGNVERCAEILLKGECIGRVIRGAYKYSSASCYGIAYLFNSANINETELKCKNIDQKNSYSILITKIFTDFK